MSRVIVTGGAGFIGSHIVEVLLEEHYEVAVIDNLYSGKLENIDVDRVRYYNVDIRNYEELEAVFSEFLPEYIIHQAAQTSVIKSIENILYDSEVNISGSINLIHLAKKYEVKKIVFASSAAIYGEPEYLPINEEHPVKPASPYGLSKYTVEKYLELSNYLYDLNYSILRYSNVYGPRQSAEGEGGVVAIFTNLMAKQIAPNIYGDGNQIRDFIYVKDIAKANVKCLTNEKNTKVNISSGAGISVNELFQKLKNLYDFEATASYKKSRKGEIKNSILGNLNAKEQLNWVPEHSIDEGLQETVDFYQSLNRNKINMY